MCYGVATLVFGTGARGACAYAIQLHHCYDKTLQKALKQDRVKIKNLAARQMWR